MLVKLVSQVGPQKYGYYVLILSQIALWSGAVYQPINRSLSRFYFEYLGKDETEKYNVIVKSILLRISAVIILLTFLITIFNQFYNNPLTLIIMMGGLLTATFKFNEYLMAMLNIIRKRKENAIITFCERYVLIGIIAVMYYSGYYNLTSVLLVYIAVTFASGMARYYYYFGDIRMPVNMLFKNFSPFEKTVLKKVFKVALPLMVIGLFSWFQSQAEKWIINNVLSTQELGSYGIMLNCINAMIAFPTFFVTDFFSPQIYSNFMEEQEGKTRKQGFIYVFINMGVVLVITFIAFLLTWIWGNEIITLISSNDYNTETTVFPYLVVGWGLYYMGYVLINLGIALNQPGKYIFPVITTGLLAVLSNWFFINKYGISGVVISLAITGVYYIGILFWVNNKIIKTSRKNAAL